MVNIRIDDLNPSIEKRVLNDLSSEDMNNIKGGIRRRRDPSSTNRRNSSTGIPSIDSRIDSWQKQLNENYDILQREFDF
ncbi:MAG: hypothetical protein EAZ77_03525 [Nostocales cyanobacterium]|nr:MAG: hypothetical protein EAZ77_03525 [Nostocales cyanobacterium]